MSNGHCPFYIFWNAYAMDGRRAVKNRRSFLVLVDGKRPSGRRVFFRSASDIAEGTKIRKILCVDWKMLVIVIFINYKLANSCMLKINPIKVDTSQFFPLEFSVRAHVSAFTISAKPAAYSMVVIDGESGFCLLAVLIRRPPVLIRRGKWSSSIPRRSNATLIGGAHLGPGDGKKISNNATRHTDESEKESPFAERQGSRFGTDLSMDKRIVTFFSKV